MEDGRRRSSYETGGERSHLGRENEELRWNGMVQKKPNRERSAREHEEWTGKTVTGKGRA
jgi:hypothetical protein